MRTNKDQKFIAEVIHVFALPSLGPGKYIVSTKIEKGIFPEIGLYLTFLNKDIWKIIGIVTAGLNKDGEEIMIEKHQQGKWDLLVEPVLNLSERPMNGTVEISICLPSNIIENSN